MAAIIAFGYALPAGFATSCLVSVAHASALAPIVPIADAMTLAAAPGRFQYGGCAVRRRVPLSWGSVGAGQVVEATNLRHRMDERDAVRASGRGGASTTPNALDPPVVERQANVRALSTAPGSLPLMALARWS